MKNIFLTALLAVFSCALYGQTVVTGGGVNAINGKSGSFTFTGGGVSCTNTTCTFTAGGSTAWGAITGTLSSQTDLQNALNLLAPLANPTLTGTANLPSTTNFNGSAMTAAATTAIGTSGATIPLNNAANTFSGNTTFSGNSGVITKGLARTINTDATTARTGLISDGYVYMSNAAARTYTLIVAPSAGQQFCIFDQAGTAGTANITVSVASAGTINGSSTSVINTNFGIQCFQYNGTSGVYFRIQ